MNVQMKNQKLFALVQPTMTLGMNGLALVDLLAGCGAGESAFR